jgi:hypothetical protein
VVDFCKELYKVQVKRKQRERKEKGGKRGKGRERYFS